MKNLTLKCRGNAAKVLYVYNIYIVLRIHVYV